MFKDQRDLLIVFNAHGVKYLVIGAHAVGVHADPRGTKDLDVFIKTDDANSKAVFAALKEYGAPLGKMTTADFNDTRSSVFQIGIEPDRVDILQGIAGVTFDEAWRQREEMLLDENTPAHVISLEHLIQNKLASGRHQDLADAEKLREVSSLKKARRAGAQKPGRKTKLPRSSSRPKI